jgi:uncharacterized protein (DUF1684 family)
MNRIFHGQSTRSRRTLVAVLLMGGLLPVMAAAQAAPARPALQAPAPKPAPAQAPGATAAQAYARDIGQWRAEREAALKTDDGWLTLVGLFWLQEGANCAGTDASCRVLLAAGSAPARIGEFANASGTITFKPAPRVDVRINGKPAGVQVLNTQPGRYDKVSVGTVTMFVIKRGQRYGVRVRDTNSQARRDFRGVHWFPTAPSYRVTARFVSHPKPTSIQIVNVLGDVEPWPSPGYAEFTLGGRQYRLHAVLDGPNARELFFVFRDLTTGKDTYAGGRFLYADMPSNGQVVLDFNKAHSPPCAFTPFATCPLPPKANGLAVRIEAGELNPHATR